MNTPPEDAVPDQQMDPASPDPAIPDPTPPEPVMEQRLSGAYQRILRVAVALSVAGALAATTLFSWQSGIGLAIGSLLAYINFVWLHHGADRLVERMIASKKTTRSDEAKPRRARFAFPFPLRYALLFGVAYVILKSYPRLLIGFIVGLILPILASMGEGIYEALVTSKIDQTNN
jgi:hypothetical protein